MKKFICAMATSVCLMGAGAAYAGSADHGYHHKSHHKSHHKGGEHHGHKHMHMLQKKLDLTDEQKEQIKAIHEVAGDGAKHKRGKGRHSVMTLDPSAADYREQVEQLAQESADRLEQSIIRRGETHAQVHAVLTPEQREELKEMREKMQERRKDRAERKTKSEAQ